MSNLPSMKDEGKESNETVSHKPKRGRLVPCLRCGKLFHRDRWDRRYCSKVCYGATIRKAGNGPLVRLPNCLICDKPVPKTGTKYCSISCAAQAKRHPREKRLKNCQQCGKEFEIRTYHWQTRYCSLECSSEAGTRLPMLTKTCLMCSATFETKKEKRKYCSPACKKDHQRALYFDRPESEQRAIVDRLRGVSDYRSGLEITLCGILDLWRFEYFPQYRIHNYFADIFVPRWNLVIEVYGCYWHQCSACGYGDGTIQATDGERAQRIRALGYSVVELWEHDIRRDAEATLRSAFENVQTQRLE